MVSPNALATLPDDAAANRRTALYMFFDKADVLLYVGVAFDPPTRWVVHAREKPWWSQVSRKEVVWYPNRAVALTAENDAILIRSPRYNVAGAPRTATPDIIPTVPVTGGATLAQHLRSQIASGQFRPGERLPSEDDMRQVYGLAIGTINRAVGELRRMGVVDYVRGYGVVVREPRGVLRVHVEPGSRITARPATTEEQDEWGEGVSALILWHGDGTGDVYPGDRTEFFTDTTE